MLIVLNFVPDCWHWFLVSDGTVAGGNSQLYWHAGEMRIDTVVLVEDTTYFYSSVLVILESYFSIFFTQHFISVLSYCLALPIHVCIYLYLNSLAITP